MAQPRVVRWQVVEVRKTARVWKEKSEKDKRTKGVVIRRGSRYEAVVAAM